jgi:hypothetical protein
MTAKEELRDIVEQLSDVEAEAALGYILNRRGREPGGGEVGAGAATSEQPRSAEDREPERSRGGLRRMAVVPAGLLVALFILVYVALMVIVGIVIIRG